MDPELPPLPSSPRGVRRALHELDRATLAARRQRFVLAARLAARRVGAGLHLDVHPSVLVGHHVVLDIWHDTRNVVVIGPGVRLGDHAWLSMRGGRCTIGRGTDIRRAVTMNCTGTLEIGEEVLLSTGLHIHCANHVAVGDMTIIGEYSTIADSTHLRTDVEVPIQHAVEASEVVFGRNIWVGAKATVTAGVHVGDGAVVAAASVVTRDVEPGWLVGGVPAKPIRPA